MHAVESGASGGIDDEVDKPSPDPASTPVWARSAIEQERVRTTIPRQADEADQSVIDAFRRPRERARQDRPEAAGRVSTPRRGVELVQFVVGDVASQGDPRRGCDHEQYRPRRGLSVPQGGRWATSNLMDSATSTPTRSEQRAGEPPVASPPFYRISRIVRAMIG